MSSFDEVFAAVKEYCKERLVLATYNLFIDGISDVGYLACFLITKSILGKFFSFVQNPIRLFFSLIAVQEVFGPVK